MRTSTQRIEVVRGHDIRATFATIERQQSDPGALSAGLVGQHSSIFVIGMGGYHEHAAAGVKLLQALPECGSAAVKQESLSRDVQVSS